MKPSGRARLLLCAWCVLTAVLLAEHSSRAVFRPGPEVLGTVPDPGRDPGVVASADAVVRGSLPVPFLDHVREALTARGGVLLVGHTDRVGPEALNRSLGLHYAVAAARRLAEELPAEIWRFACASAGEGPNGGAAVAAFPWTPPDVEPTPAGEVAILAPSGRGTRSDSLWALWGPGRRLVVMGLEGPESTRLLELPAEENPVRLPLPGAPTRLALGTAGPPSPAAQMALPRAIAEPDLALVLVSVESGAARLRCRIPAPYSDATVWAHDIPYPVPARPSGQAELRVALFPGETGAYLQALDPAGRVVVGPRLRLPGLPGEPPDLIAVLVWGDDGADLDLHAWRGSGHTQPTDPDPAVSPTAAVGARLLFDGDADSRASAVAVQDPSGVELEVWCYSDLGGAGTRAWLYLAMRPGDPLESRQRVLGPRLLSDRPLEARWAPRAPGEGPVE